jgi:hypothetical protein
MDICALERERINSVDVSARTRQHDRPVRHGTIEILARGETMFIELRFVQTATEQPGSIGQCAVALLQLGVQYLKARNLAQVEHARKQVTNLPDMRVRVVEAGDYSATAKIDAPRGCSCFAQQGLCVADREDAFAANRDGAGLPMQDRAHNAVVEKKIQLEQFSLPLA